MNTLFGLPMDTIMIWMLAFFLIVTGLVAALALRKRLFFKMGLRNIPRRRAQTLLIVFGLMLSTLIITSAFGTGDTVSYSVRSSTVNNLGPIDEAVVRASDTTITGTPSVAGFLAPRVVTRIESALASDKNVDGVMPAIVRYTALQDLTSGQTKAQVALAGIPAAYPHAFGSLTANGGAPVTLSQLSGNEIYLNQHAADALNARAGDRLTLYLGARPEPATVRAILRDEDLAAGGLLTGGQTGDPTLLLPLARVQRSIGQPNGATVVLVSNRGDAMGGAAYSDPVSARLRALLANTGRVATAHALLAGPAGRHALAQLLKDPTLAGVQAKLKEVQAQIALAGQSDLLKSLLSDPDVISALKTIKAPSIARPLNDALASVSDYGVEPLKKSGLDQADLLGSVFTSVFIIFGLFSISAGIMLIFLIFVMLAAERRAEMGMARAIGTQRRHLIQQFVFEGYVYDLGAALVGMLLGILVGLGMAKILSILLARADLTVQSHVEPRSLVVAFCLGALVTFATVAVSAWRVSRLNIVAAIRDLPEGFGVKGGLADAFRRSLKRLLDLRRDWRRAAVLLAATAFVAVQIGKPSGILLVPGLVLLWSFRPVYLGLYSRGPLLLLSGYLLAAQGIDANSEFMFGIGASLLLVGVAMLLRWMLAGARVPDAVRNRIGFSLAGISLVIFWLLPFDALNRITGQMNGGIEMFFVSGIMLVLGGVWTVMYNSDLLLGGLLQVFGRNGRLAPILKTAVTYPMQYKFRTGLTLAMFSLVIFTLMVMSVLIGSMSGGLNVTRDAGGYQIYGAVSPNSPIQGIGQRIAANPALHGITATGGMARTAAALRQPGQSDQSWQSYNANLLDDAYLGSTQFVLHDRARGYNSDAQVWQALRTHPGYAVVDSALVKSRNGGMGSAAAFQISGFTYQDTRFSPVTIEMRDPASGTILHLTVIGVLDQRAANLYNLTPGVYTSENTLRAAGLPAASPNLYVFRVAPGHDVHTTALALGRAFLSNGLDVKETQREFDTNQAINIGLNNLLQAFMGLGLVVGIAALGVVATRSVVERRQQIGMMRAIGFQRGMIRASFLLESSFVAVLGTLLGVVLGLVLAKNLVDSFAKDSPGITLTVPWAQIGLIVAIAYAASLLTTYVPAWQASRVYPAEALRYE